MHLFRDRERAANDRRAANKLNDIADQVRTVQCFSDAAFQVGENFPPEHAGPLLALLALISDQLICIADKLQSEAQADAA